MEIKEYQIDMVIDFLKKIDPVIIKNIKRVGDAFYLPGYRILAHDDGEMLGVIRNDGDFKPVGIPNWLNEKSAVYPDYHLDAQSDFYIIDELEKIDITNEDFPNYKIFKYDPGYFIHDPERNISAFMQTDKKPLGAYAWKGNPDEHDRSLHTGFHQAITRKNIIGRVEIAMSKIDFASMNPHRGNPGFNKDMERRMRIQ